MCVYNLQCTYNKVSFLETHLKIVGLAHLFYYMNVECNLMIL